MNTPNITVNRFWTPIRVRHACIDNDLYTRGDNTDFEEMLDRVLYCEPTAENLYLIAQDIAKHSEDRTVTNVMFLLEREAVITTFEIDGQDDI